MTPGALLIHVPDVPLGLAWYQNAFPMAKPRYLSEFDMTVLQINDFLIELVQADNKVGSGKFGTVLYWSVACLSEALTHFEALGAKLYRGPMVIEDGLSMCQLEDPFGNLIGLKGP